MKLKTVVSAVLLGTFTLVSASGCSIADLDADSLIRPPKTVGDEAEIEQLINETAQSGYILKYPKSGNYRSAIVMTDLDGDEIDEAVAFYRVPDNTTEMHMLIMYQSEDKWNLSENCTIEASDVDCVEFADVNGDGHLEILSGYTTYNSSINRLACNSYSDGKTESITVERNYSSFLCSDFDSDGIDEVMLFSLFTTENDASSVMLDYNADECCLYAKATVSMDPNVVKYRNFLVTSFDDSTKGVVVDGAFATEELNTQVIFYSKELSVLRNPLYKEKEKNITQRSLNILSDDINDDLQVEIPIVTKLPASSKEDSQTVADKVRWNAFYPENEMLTFYEDAVVNLEYGYAFKMPDNWIDNSVTARLNSEEATMTFYVWNDKKKKLDDELFCIKAFDINEWDLGENGSGYTLISKNERYAYAFSDVNKDNEFSLGDDEIKTAFASLPDNVI